MHLAVVLACLPCAAHLWRRPGLPAWAAHSGLAVAMVVAHPLAMAVAKATGPHPHMTMAAAPAAGLTAAVAAPATVLALSSAWVLPERQRPGGRRRPQISGSSGVDGAVRRVPQA